MKNTGISSAVVSLDDLCCSKCALLNFFLSLSFLCCNLFFSLFPLCFNSSIRWNEYKGNILEQIFVPLWSQSYSDPGFVSVWLRGEILLSIFDLFCSLIFSFLLFRLFSLIYDLSDNVAMDTFWDSSLCCPFSPITDVDSFLLFVFVSLLPS